MNWGLFLFEKDGLGACVWKFHLVKYYTQKKYDECLEHERKVQQIVQL